MTNKFIKILGINHDRFVGIARDNNEAYDFYILNADGYRPAENSSEVEKCKKAALKYYMDCIPYTVIDDFGVAEVEITDSMIDDACEDIYE